MMKANILIDSGAIGAPVTKQFKLDHTEGREEITLFQRGLAGAEAATVQMLTSATDPDLAPDGEWQDCQEGGAVLQLDTSDTRLVLRGNGFYRVRIASSLNPVVVGFY